MSGEIQESTRINGAALRYVKLNVGGCLFYTTIGTLTKYDGMLRAMFSGRQDVIIDSEGWVVIDRCGKHFGTILNYLRNGDVVLGEHKKDLYELLVEAKYYLLTQLVTKVEDAVQAILNKEEKSTQELSCCIPYISSSMEEHIVINGTDKPVVKLVYNRNFNKYSYTSNSDDNFLRNLELFEKLALRFAGRIVFIKDIIGCIDGVNDICSWCFYGKKDDRHEKLTEISCARIVYGTDKKHTKVEFPETRILDWMLNLMNYEPHIQNGPVGAHYDRIQSATSVSTIGSGEASDKDEV